MHYIPISCPKPSNKVGHQTLRMSTVVESETNLGSFGRCKPRALLTQSENWWNRCRLQLLIFHLHPFATSWKLQHWTYWGRRGLCPIDDEVGMLQPHDCRQHPRWELLSNSKEGAAGSQNVLVIFYVWWNWWTWIIHLGRFRAFLPWAFIRLITASAPCSWCAWTLQSMPISFATIVILPHDSQSATNTCTHAAPNILHGKSKFQARE